MLPPCLPSHLIVIDYSADTFPLGEPEVSGQQSVGVLHLDQVVSLENLLSDLLLIGLRLLEGSHLIMAEVVAGHPELRRVSILPSFSFCRFLASSRALLSSSL